MKDIAEKLGLESVRAVVSDFYDRIQQHPRLAEPFERVTDWPEHKAHLTHFWWVTLGGNRYRDKPYRVAEKHMLAGFTPALLDEWLALFLQTLNAHLAPALAGQWYARAENIGRSLVLMHEHRQRAGAMRPGLSITCR